MPSYVYIIEVGGREVERHFTRIDAERATLVWNGAHIRTIEVAA